MELACALAVLAPQGTALLLPPRHLYRLVESGVGAVQLGGEQQAPQRSFLGLHRVRANDGLPAGRVAGPLDQDATGSAPAFRRHEMRTGLACLSGANRPGTANSTSGWAAADPLDGQRLPVARDSEPYGGTRE